jgi:ubiquinone/menaquinone biosynthesis C-methylase UbiE
MGFFDLPRIPESEVMDDAREVQAYSSAAAQRHLDQIDDTFVAHALRLVQNVEKGTALDIGTGPGQIVLKFASRLPSWSITGVDRSPAMIAQARANLAGACATDPGVPARVEFQVADGNRLAFADASFDFVMCNSVLHHLARPQNLLAEIARLAKPDGAILLRDLRRPSFLAFPLHVRWHGRRYEGLMYELYSDSVRSAYTELELRSMLAASNLAGARVFVHASTHLGIERATRPAR